MGDHLRLADSRFTPRAAGFQPVQTARKLLSGMIHSTTVAKPTRSPPLNPTTRPDSNNHNAPRSALSVTTVVVGVQARGASLPALQTAIDKLNTLD
jgi:hypothetical protein